MMNEFYLPNICYNNRRDTQKLCLAYTKDTLNKIIIIIVVVMYNGNSRDMIIYLISIMKSHNVT